MCNTREIDRRVKGTEMEAMVDPHGGPQRAGVLGSLNMVGNALRLLPKEADTTERWSARGVGEAAQGLDLHHIPGNGAGSIAAGRQHVA